MSPPGKKAHGQVRQSQVVTTFGPGSLLDLPDYSVLVGGLEHWFLLGDEIIEDRLAEKLKRLLDITDLKLYAPPPESDDPNSPKTGITAWQFPEWFITQDAEESDRETFVRSRLLIHRGSLTKRKYIDLDRRKRNVVPIRFVRACRRGHIGDIDWYGYVHRDDAQCRRQLLIDERGTSGDLSEIWIRCECGQERPMSDAARMELRSLGNCDGARPWLGQASGETCAEPSRLLVRTASNAYFPQKMSVISIPDREDDIDDAVNQLWDTYLRYVESIEQLQQLRNTMPPVRDVLAGFSDEDVFQVIDKRRRGGLSVDKPVKQAELETLLASQEEIGTDRPDGDFFARALPRDKWDKPWMESIDRIVLVHRLREVIAQVGFTRFEAISPDIEGELEMGVARASLATEVSWLPAVENRGEGIFIGFKKSAIETWLDRPEVKNHGERLLQGFSLWQKDHPTSRRQFPSLPYIMLHSLSHLLITAVALECGYPASSIRERVYAGSAGFGILLFTGSPDAEGTLGGLVDEGRRIHEHIKSALKLGALCSNDPVCAQHDPQNELERKFLLGAACHGCLLIAETCCEQNNVFLDRALVVSTLENLEAEFFPQVGI